VNDYRIDSTSEADEHARAFDAWWRDHRSTKPDLFVNELARSLSLLARMPRLGVIYDSPGAPANIRRLLMRPTQSHLYYSVDTNARVVTIRAIWHASRGLGPF